MDIAYGCQYQSPLLRSHQKRASPSRTTNEDVRDPGLGEAL